MEQWRHVVGWKGLYEVSDRGRVRSVDRTVRTKKGPMRFKGRVLKPDHTGELQPYLMVNLSRPGGPPKTSYVHVIVARAFLGPCPKGKEVCHRDGSRRTNHASNLRYGTRKSNAADRKIHGTNHGPDTRGTKNGMARLDESKVRFIRASVASLKTVARLLGVHFGTVHAVRTRKTWAHVE